MKLVRLGVRVARVLIQELLQRHAPVTLAKQNTHTKKTHIHFNNAVTSIYDDLQLQLPTGVTCWSLR